MSEGPHLTPAEAVEFSMGALPADRQGAAEHHLAECHRCRSMLAEVLESSDSNVLEKEPPTPMRVGRFVVLKSLGAGAMGLVFAAYDPQLDRRVALKLRRGNPEADRQLVSEGRAMAKLSHPNIVAVHEVGLAGETVFLVMEYVEGTVLREHALKHRNDPERVLATFADAGRGLAAAHHAGLVHRDFKPENVLVDLKGRARVTDFGLASINNDRGVVGTPAYMAPEVLAKQPATVASDQFSFCVALYEALVGRRPWEGADELAREGPVPRIPPNRARAKVRRAIERGLSVDPAARFPSMDALLQALESPSRETLALRVLVVVTSIAAVASIGLVAVRGKAPRCDGQAALETQWPAERRAALAAAAAEVVPSVERWTTRWLEEFRDACDADAVVSEHVSDDRRRCLDDGLRSLRAAAELAMEKPASAQRLIGTLPEPAICRAAPPIGAWPKPSVPDDEVFGLRKQLAAITALREAGLISDALKRVDALLAELPAEHALELVSRASYERALLIRAGHLEEADRLLLWVFQQALRAGDDELATLSAMARSRTIGAFGGRTSEALAQAEIARGLMERLPAGHRYVVGFHWIWGEALVNAERLEEAEQVLERGLAQATTPGTKEYRHLLGYSIANLSFTRGEWAKATAHARGALVDAIEFYPQKSPGLAPYKVAVALPQLHLEGSTPEARQLLDESAELLGKLSEQEAPGVWANLVGTQALEVRGRGDFAQSLVLSERAAALYTAAFPHREVETATNLAHAALLAGNRTVAERALIRAEAKPPSSPPERAWRATIEAMAGRQWGEPKRRAKALEGLDPSTLLLPERLWAQLELGEAALDRGAAGEASTRCRAMLTQLAETPMAPLLRASVHFFCVRALGPTDPDAARLRESARETLRAGLLPDAERARFAQLETP